MPNFKRNGGKIFGVHLSKAEQEALDIEIKSQIAEQYHDLLENVDAMVLWTLHTHPHLRFGKKRLKRFYKFFIKQHRELIDYYECKEDSGRLCKFKLRDLGIDLAEWQKELEEENDDSNVL